MELRTPTDSQHIAIAGRTGSGKTIAALELLSTRDLERMAWIIFDHKHDDNISKLPAEKLNVTTMFLPRNGLHVIRPGENDSIKQFNDDADGFLHRAFKKGNIGIYVDEGHLLGKSEAIRNILVAGRSKKVPLIWTSQRAAWIDTFIWSQSSFYRVFDLQTKHDIKRFEENFPVRWKKPAEYHSYYYDVSQGKVAYLQPSQPIDRTAAELDLRLKHHYKVI